MIPIPASWFGLAFLIALVVPGLVYTGVKAALSGSRDVDQSTLARALQAVVISAAFDAVTALLIIPMLHINPLIDPRGSIEAHPRGAAVLFLACGIGAPAILAWLLHGRPPFLRPVYAGVAWSWARLTDSPYAGTPTAWDFALERRSTGWIRVRTNEGTWVGGVYDTNSYGSTFPRSRDLFIEEQWRLDADGTFTEVIPDTRGVWVAIGETSVVEFLDAAPEQPPHGLETPSPANGSTAPATQEDEHHE